MILRRTSLVLLLLVGLMSTGAFAQNSLHQGEFEVHFSALASTTLSPQIARQYAITRSSSRALLNVAILRQHDDGGTSAVTAHITGSATNLAGQRQNLTLREVREGDAIYYLAEPRTSEGETLRFELDVIPEGSDRVIDIRFEQQFFAPQP
jgi:hypothetical protein